jgi:CheY-like chemotaxis protein
VESIPSSPHQILAEVVSVLRVPARQKGIVLDYRWESRVPETIKTDPHRLKQLLMNLVNNAIKFTEEGSVLLVAKVLDGKDEHRLRLDVRDTGIGIPEEKRRKIFEPFVQADTSVTRKYGGTGLGLAISYRIAQALGGELTVESAMGRGSVFSATIDVGDLTSVKMSDRVPDSRTGDLGRQTNETGGLKGVNILLVDDGETNRKLISLFLTRGGATVQMAENGALAVHAAENGKFDVILMDMQMPVMDGYTATRRLRENGYSGPVIALTAHAMKGDREKCHAAGCSGYLSKPVNVDELVGAIQGALKSVPAPETSNREMTNQTARPLATENPMIKSTLPTEDEEIREVVREFVDSISDRLDAMSAALTAENYDDLAKLAHALKGSGGTAGFDCFTNPAGRIEQWAKQQVPDEIGGTIEEIRRLEQCLVV